MVTGAFNVNFRNLLSKVNTTWLTYLGFTYAHNNQCMLLVFELFSLISLVSKSCYFQVIKFSSYEGRNLINFD